MECICPCQCGCQSPDFVVNEETGFCPDCEEGNHELPPHDVVVKYLPLYKEIVRNYEDALRMNIWEKDIFVRGTHDGLVVVE